MMKLRKGKAEKNQRKDSQKYTHLKNREGVRNTVRRMKIKRKRERELQIISGTQKDDEI